MKDNMELPKEEFQAEGRCCIQYTDPLTGKILEEIRSKNHVFTKQFMGTSGFQSTALVSDLLLCQGGYYQGDDIPMIPGDPIGYGRPATEGTGFFRGTYRTADSYYNRRTIGKVSSKYVYDFLNTQALGRVDWVGLTAELGTGASTAAWNPPYRVEAPTTSYKVYDCETGTWYYAAWVGDSTNNYELYLYRNNAFKSIGVTSVNITELAGVAKGRYNYTGNIKVFLDAETKQVYVAARYAPVGSTTYAVKCYVLNADCSAVEGSYTFNSTSLANAVCGAYYGGKLTWFYCMSDNNYQQYQKVQVDLESGDSTVENTGYDATTRRNGFRFNMYTAYVYKNYLWYERYYDRSAGVNLFSSSNDYFLSVAPMYDLVNERITGTLPPSGLYGSDYNYYRVGVSPLATFEGQWGSYSYRGGAPTMPFAYTCCQIPEDTPDRPDGAGMTVTYELDITW